MNPEIESNLIWDKHYDLYDDDREHDEVGMIVLGREIKKIVSKNQKLNDRILHIIDKALEQKTRFLMLMIENTETETIEMKAAILRRIEQRILAE